MATRPPSNAGFAFVFLGYPAVLLLLGATGAWPLVLLWLLAGAAYLGWTARR